MIDDVSGQAVGLIDLDTVSRSLCTTTLATTSVQVTLTRKKQRPTVSFDLQLCRSILEGYLSIGRSFLTPADFHYLLTIRLIPRAGPGALWILAGDRYFRTDQANQNLDRARVQFALTESVEHNWSPLRIWSVSCHDNLITRAVMHEATSHEVTTAASCYQGSLPDIP